MARLLPTVKFTFAGHSDLTSGGGQRPIGRSGAMTLSSFPTLNESTPFHRMMLAGCIDHSTSPGIPYAA